MEKLKSHRTFNGHTEFWRHASRETQTEMKFSTFRPDGEIRGCLFWLSGLTCNEENFISKAGAQRILAEERLMVICPDTSPRGLDLPKEHEADDFGSGAGFYLDATAPEYCDHYRMASYITTELHQMVQSEFGILPGQISLAGHSMGGHGALTLGLRFPEKFCAISAFSPICHPTQVPWGQKAFSLYLGENREAWKTYDATELVRQGHHHSVRILVDQGTKDPFLENQLWPQAFVDACKNQNQPLDFRLREGFDHSYYFISTFIESHIRFHATAME